MAWFLSKVSLFERIGFWIRVNKDADADLLNNYNIPLGGKPALVEEGLKKNKITA